MVGLADQHPSVIKLASDAELSHDVIYLLAEAANMPVVPFIKWAYSDVPAFIGFLKAAGEGRVKAAGGMNMLMEALGHLKNLGEGGLKALTSHPGSSPPGREMFMEGGRGLSKTIGGIGENMVNSPMRKALTAGGLGAGAASLGVGAGAGVRGLMGGSPMAAKVALTVQNSTPDIGKIMPDKGPGASSPSRTPPVALGGPGSDPGGPGGSPGMSPARKNLILGGSAAALGGTAGYAAGRNRKKKRDKQSADSFGMDVMRRAVIKKACDLMRKEAAEVLCRHRDAVAGSMSLEKSAAVRSVQRDIASGKPLAAAIKTAYPRLSGEQRGILASQMVRSA